MLATPSLSRLNSEAQHENSKSIMILEMIPPANIEHTAMKSEKYDNDSALIPCPEMQPSVLQAPELKKQPP